LNPAAAEGTGERGIESRPTRTSVAAPQTLGDRWKLFKRRLIADPSFQRWAVRFWPTRPVARRKADQLFGICAGFVYAQTLAACIRLDLFRMLEAGPLSAEAVAQRTGLRPEVAERLMRAAASLDLLDAYSRGRYGLGDLGAAALANPGIEAMVRHHALLYEDLADPLALLRHGPGGGRLARFWGYAAGGDPKALGDAEAGGYSALMAASLGFAADDLLAAYPFGRHRRMLDVGGGVGAFARRVVERHPSLAVTVFDLPAVAAAASRECERRGDNRIAAVGGDAFRDPLPEGHDLVTLLRVLHDHDDGLALALLKAARAALPPGGVLLVAEPMTGPRAASAMGDAYFGFYLFAMGSGRVRSTAEVEAMLAAAGFGTTRRLRTPRPLLVSAIAASA
jgi:demethylspheroidene O-methyltransferase